MLIAFPSIWPQLSPGHTTLYHSRLPNNDVTWGVLLALSVTSFFFALFFLFMEKKDPEFRSFSWVLAAAALAPAAASVHSTAAGRSDQPLICAIAFCLTLCAAAGLWWLRPTFYQTVMQKSFIALSLVGFSIVWMAPELFYLAARHQPVDWQGYANAVPADRAACHCGLQGSGRRIVWLLFDELSFDQTFEHRFPGLALSNFDQLERESVTFQSLAPAGYFTERVVPSLFLGQTVDGIHSDLDGWPKIRLAGRRDWRAFDAHATLFADAERFGWTTGVVGWFNPYCRVLATTLDFCYSKISFEPGTASAGDVVLQNAIAPIENKWRLMTGDQEDVERQHEADLQDILQQAQGLIRNEKILFVFIHLPLPHPPGIYDRKTEQMREGGTYIDNLALADRALGELTSTLNATRLASETTLIVSSDHSWRVPMWQAAPGWTKEEEEASQGKFDARPVLMIHFPSETQATRFPEPFQALRLHDVLLHMLHGELSSQAQLLDWLQQGSQPIQICDRSSAQSDQAPAFSLRRRRSSYAGTTTPVHSPKPMLTKPSRSL